MKKTCLFTAFVFILVAAFWTSVPTGCANIVPPAGGPRDTIPPLLLNADPPDSTVNFNSKEIVLTFDELIDLKDITNNLILTPLFERSPAIKVKGRTMTIPFADPLEPNTTYIINFGNAIVDYTESNAVQDLVYTFSTGPFLDSLELTGKVLLAETGDVDTTLVAILHKKFNDSAVYNDRPMYAAKLDRDGNFRFRNLPKDTFALYVLGDAGLQRRYTSPSQLFAFIEERVIPGESDSLLMYAYREKSQGAAPAQTAATRLPNSDRRLKFTIVTTGTHDLLDDYIMNFLIPLRSLDTTRMQLSTDSLFTPASYSIALDSTRKELRIKSNWIENTNYNLILEKDFATDTTGRQLLKSDTLFFTTKKKSDYGNLVLRFRNLDLSLNPVLQFLQNGQVVYSVPLKSPVYSNELFQTGDYDLRILFDRNDNGQWDPGNFYGVKRQPELVRPLERKITVKPDWENEMEILL